MVSMTRSPVVRAVFPGSFSSTGRGLRTGQKCDSASSLILPVVSFWTSRTVSLTLNLLRLSPAEPYTCFYPSHRPPTPNSRQVARDTYIDVEGTGREGGRCTIQKH